MKKVIHSNKKKVVRAGDAYSRLSIISEVFGHNRRRFLCQCVCGGMKEVSLSSLTEGRVKSCGCLSRELARGRLLRHGSTKTKLYNCWSDMKRRAKARSSCDVFPPWSDFQTFKVWSLGNGYDETLVLCRKGDVGDYHPDNVSWGTKQKNCEEAHARNWEVTTPAGEVLQIYNLHTFCRENKLSPSCMSQVANNKIGYKSHRGYKVRRLT